MDSVDLPFEPVAETTVLVLLVSVVLVGLTPAPAPAQGTSDRAVSVDDLSRQQKQDFLKFVRAGKRAYTNGNFEKAIPFFERAYDVLPRPELKYRIALCHERAGHPKEAIEFYRAFLREKPDTEKRGQVESTLERLHERVEKQSRVRIRIESTPSSAHVYIRPKDEPNARRVHRGTTPLTTTIAAERIELVLEKEGYEKVRRNLELQAGETYNFNYALPEHAPSAGGADSKTIALVATVIGGVGATIGGTLYGVGMHCGRNRNNCSRSLYNTSAIGSYVGGGVGVAGLGTAAVLGLTRNSNRRTGGGNDGPRPALDIVASPDHFGLRLQF